MSRLAKAKEQKRKNRIKATACGLALSLLVGSTQYLGTHALFTDTEDVSSDLAISTGDVDIKEHTNRISVEDGEDTISGSVFEGDLIKNGEEKSKTFDISNQGTLNQNLKIELSTNSTLNDSTLEQIKYKLEVKDETRTIQTINTNLKEIRDKNYENYKLDDVGILEPNPNRKLTFISTISLKDANINLNNATDVDFKLNIVATQLGYTNNKGFTDSYNQDNVFTVVSHNGGYLDPYFRIGFSRRWIAIPLPKMFEDIEIIDGKGQFANAKESILSDNIFTIRKTYLSSFKIYDDNEIGINFSEDQKLTLKITNDGVSEYWDIYFRYRNWDLQAYYVEIEPPSKELGADVIEQSNEEVLPSEPEVIELPKEEVLPSEPEVIEPPKEEEVEIPSESEVIEPPKAEEEVEIPSEPEVVEPPKEEEVLPSEPEIIDTPNNEEIVAQKKEEIEE